MWGRSVIPSGCSYGQETWCVSGSGAAAWEWKGHMLRSGLLPPSSWSAPYRDLHTSGIFNKESLEPTFLTHNCSSSRLPLVRSCSLYIWQIEALWFSNWLTLCSVFWNLFCKYSYKKFISLQIIHVWFQWTCRESQPPRQLSVSVHEYGFSRHAWLCRLIRHTARYRVHGTPSDHTGLDVWPPKSNLHSKWTFFFSNFKRFPQGI